MSETTECAKRAVRIKALRAKADSTEFPEEAITLREKADELQAKNDALGYVDTPPQSSPFNSAWDQFFGTKWKEDLAEQKLKEYQRWIKKHETKKTQNDCDHEWILLDSITHGEMRHCSKCGKEQVKAPGGWASSYEEYKAEDIKSGRFNVHNPPPTQRRRSSHAECYANGWHENSKAGRASCRRTRG
jgi:Protein of unknown function (DUF2786)